MGAWDDVRIRVSQSKTDNKRNIRLSCMMKNRGTATGILRSTKRRRRVSGNTLSRSGRLLTDLYNGSERRAVTTVMNYHESLSFAHDEDGIGLHTDTKAMSCQVPILASPDPLFLALCWQG